MYPSGHSYMTIIISLSIFFIKLRDQVIKSLTRTLIKL
uniref:Uncharacterized protein n=1 Tax=Rhizophora mucronata TaxID=61149 RepID=A0A2P2P9M6_RHIMU